jgi:RNA polymerase sigma-70 factor (ECF subfamily)
MGLMQANSASTQQIDAWLARWRDGDGTAVEQLIGHASTRLLALARHMLRGHPALRRWTDTDDVLQNALLRLLRAVEDVRPATARDFYGLASLQIRRELIDLSRRYFGPHGVGRNHVSAAAALADPLDTTLEPQQLAQWSEVHERIGQLPPEEREVVDLVYYQGLTQADAAAVLGVSSRTVLRRWQSALIRLHRGLIELPCPTTP